jgi:hypothetical protein
LLTNGSGSGGSVFHKEAVPRLLLRRPLSMPFMAEQDRLVHLVGREPVLEGRVVEADGVLLRDGGGRCSPLMEARLGLHGVRREGGEVVRFRSG